MKQEAFEKQVQAAQSRMMAFPRAKELGGDLPADDLLPAMYAELETAMEELQVANEELRQQNGEIEETRLAVERQRQRYQDLFEFAPEGYLVTDMQGVIQEANRAAAHRLGVTPSYLVTKPLIVFVADTSKKELRRMLITIQHEGRTREWEGVMQPRDGEPFPAALTVEAFYTPDGRGASLRWLLRDITEHKRAEAAMRDWNVELERRVGERTAELEVANALKDELLAREERSRVELATLNERLRDAMVESHHRIKNNLQSVSALMEMLVEDNPDIIRTNEVATLCGHVRAMATIHDVLTHETAEGYGLFISAKRLLDRLFPLMQQVSGGRRLRFDVEEVLLTARQGTSVSLIANELILNALKHGRGEVHVTLSLKNDAVMLEVCDDGPGFPVDFDQGNGTSTGLKLVESLARWDLGGQAHFEDRPEGGARVIVVFPMPVHA